MTKTVMVKTTCFLFLTILLSLHFIDCYKRRWFIVCLSGVTCGGKSTVTRSLHKLFDGSVMIKQDSYYLADNDPRHIQLPAMQWRNRELMSSLDMHKMRKDIEKVICRNDSQVPLLLLDGFMLYYDKYITSLCDLKFFFLLSKDASKDRRKKRNRRVPDIDRYFEEYVWPAYLKYKEDVFGDNPDAVLIDGEADNNTIVETISSRIKKTFGSSHQHTVN